jgi:hypothetical protein
VQLHPRRLFRNKKPFQDASSYSCINAPWVRKPLRGGQDCSCYTRMGPLLSSRSPGSPIYCCLSHMTWARLGCLLMDMDNKCGTSTNSEPWMIMWRPLITTNIELTHRQPSRLACLVLRVSSTTSQLSPTDPPRPYSQLDLNLTVAQALFTYPTPARSSP